MRRRTTAAALAAVVALPLLTACGDTNRLEANPETARPVKLASVQPTVFPARSASPSAPAGSASASPSASKAEEPAPEPGVVLATGDNKFTPAEIKVKVGEKVTWKNTGGFHTVTGGDGNADPSSPIGDKPLADATSTHEVTFDKAGTYPYFCQPHVALGMKGTVVVS